jgi:hypothetical protein
MPAAKRLKDANQAVHPPGDSRVDADAVAASQSHGTGRSLPHAQKALAAAFVPTEAGWRHHQTVRSTHRATL